ncbi:hypothetical protein SCHPADRAFT_838392 [Schizopora paradoxa]|uniref:Uncharacterized protein n=1 Tax=Schizopora paradoxa TaxID=27342 RepID=A0A0H2R325_9AGAM|nr:hypothetical protein SCHPADRAFT_838392 [Schizopora paradoxa]
MYGRLNDPTNGHGWSIGQNCSDCDAKLDPSQTFDRTWHDASVQHNGNDTPFATVSFTGVAIYVMGIIVISTPATINALNSSKIFFQVDGTTQGSFLSNASLGPETVYSYNTTLFAKTNLSNELHNITVMCGDGADPSADSVCLLDRFIYT